MTEQPKEVIQGQITKVGEPKQFPSGGASLSMQVENLEGWVGFWGTMASRQALAQQYDVGDEISFALERKPNPKGGEYLNGSELKLLNKGTGFSPASKIASGGQSNAHTSPQGMKKRPTVEEYAEHLKKCTKLVVKMADEIETERAAEKGQLPKDKCEQMKTVVFNNENIQKWSTSLFIQTQDLVGGQ